MTGTVDTHAMARGGSAQYPGDADLPRFWPIAATVSYLPDPHRVPQACGRSAGHHLPPGEGGFHQTRNGQPTPRLSPPQNEWTVAPVTNYRNAVDPSGNRLQTSVAIGVIGDQVRDFPGRFEYLVEACDPCEADRSPIRSTGSRVGFHHAAFLRREPTAGRATASRR